MPVRPRRKRVYRLGLTPDVDVALHVGPNPLHGPSVEELRPYFMEFRRRYGSDTWGVRYFERGNIAPVELVPLA